MLGMFFMAMEAFLDAQGDAEAWPLALGMAGLEDQEFDPVADYPDNSGERLLTAASRVLGATPEETGEALGFFLGNDLLEMGRAAGLIPDSWRSLDILEHAGELLWRTYRQLPDSPTAPIIRSLRLRHGETDFVYLSHPVLCPLIKGMINAFGERFGEPLLTVESVCRRKGSPVCRYAVTLDDPEMLKYVNVTREFALVKQRRERLTFFNQYRGLSVSHHGQLLQYDAERITVQVSPQQAMAMKAEGRTHLSVPHLPIGLSARVARLHLGKQIAVLEELRLADGGFGHRNAVRIAPSAGIVVRLSHEVGEFEGRLGNISVTGASLHLPLPSPFDEAALFSPIHLSLEIPLKWVELDDTLELGAQEIEMEANLLYLEGQKDRQQVRLLFDRPGERERCIIERFIEEHRESLTAAEKP
ncbi:MAG: heme NO-binding domain-containing protein [Magnetococcales bacterium]|nr:heme NO-binding domain-containing protein [Magnetococcales bacterium]